MGATLKLKFRTLQIILGFFLEILLTVPAVLSPYIPLLNLLSTVAYRFKVTRALDGVLLGSKKDKGEGSFVVGGRIWRDKPKHGLIVTLCRW